MTNSVASLVAISIAFSAGIEISMANSTDYHERLKMADAFVKRKKTLLENHSRALSVSRLTQLLERDYREGETWKIAATRFVTDQARKFAPNAEDRVDERKGPVGVFTYKVEELRRGPEAEIDLRVTQSVDRRVDPRVDAVVFTLSRAMEAKSRTYFLQGGESQYQVIGNSIPIRGTPLDLFPLSFPELETAFEKEVSDLPELPEQLKEIAAKHGYAPDLSRSIWLEQNDMFGRPVRVLWEKGKPWPSYIETPTGVAILLNEGARS